MNRLHGKGFISGSRDKAKSVVFTDAGLDETKRLLERLFSKATFQRQRAFVDHGGGTLSARLVRSGRSAANLRRLNQAADAVFRKGHVPIIGVNMALPLIDSVGQESYERIMMPLSLHLTERCDAVLRIEGVSQGADEEVARFLARGLRVFHSVDEIPSVFPDAVATRPERIAKERHRSAPDHLTAETVSLSVFE